jgi:hypothetical protein
MPIPLVGGDGFAVTGGSRLRALLACADGYAVRATDGTRLGRVIRLTSADDGSATVLRVRPRGWRALAGPRRVPIERVLTVLPARREVILVGEERYPGAREG